jgi:hypothetical protein
MRHLQQFHLKYKDKGLVVLGFDCSDDKNIALEMLRENDATFTNIIDSSEAALKTSFHDYQTKGASAVPMSYVIDRDGVIVDAWYGYDEGEPKAIAALKKAGGELAEAVSQEINAEIARSADEIHAAAQRLFEAIRSADYDHDWMSNKDWKNFPAKGVDYTVNHGYISWVRWVCTKFKANPIVEVRLGKVFANPDGLPAIHYELQLKDGEVLQGDLPFIKHPKTGKWTGREGLDWHLREKP